MSRPFIIHLGFPVSSAGKFVHAPSRRMRKEGVGAEEAAAAEWQMEKMGWAGMAAAGLAAAAVGVGDGIDGSAGIQIKSNTN